MATAVSDKRSQRVVTSDGRLKFHSKERQPAGIQYDYWDNMSPTEQERYREVWPDFDPLEEPRTSRIPAPRKGVVPKPTQAARVVEPEPTTRYGDYLAWFAQRIAALETTVANPMETPDRRDRASSDILQYRAATEVYTEAATIPEGSAVWFVTDYGEFKVSVPPVVEGFNRERSNLRSSDHYYFAKDPVEIAALRRAVRNKESRIFEKPPQTFPIIDYAHSEFEHWVSGEGAVEAYFSRQNKRYRQV